MDIVRKAQEAIAARRLIEPKSRVVAAVSGGADSTALLVVLEELSHEMDLELAAAHLDHRIRRGSAKEQIAVSRLASALGVPFLAGSIDVPAEARKRKIGIEEAARLIRYRFLERVAHDFGAETVALGHTRDDQVETILHRILRGTGWRGLMGIPSRRGIFVRPLLDFSRDDLVRFLSARGISYITDESNRDEKYYRNRIRNRLLPYLRRHFNPAVDESIGRLQESLEEGWRRLEEPLLEMIPEPQDNGAVILPLPELARMGDFEIYLIIDLTLRERFHLFQDFEKKHYDAVKRLVRESQSGRRITLPHGVRIAREQQSIVVRLKDNAPIVPGELLVPEEGTYLLPFWNLRLEIDSIPPAEAGIWGDREAHLASIRFPVRVRARRPGDRMTPFGMRGKKKLSDIFIDAKIPLRIRDRRPVFEDRDGPFWVPGVVTDERTRITPRTRHVIRMRLYEEPSATK
jgi:tRNA(Ile)-lysidine synthase